MMVTDLRSKIVRWFSEGQTSAHDFYRRRLCSIQGLMVAPIGAFFLLTALVCGSRRPWLETWDIAVALAVFVSTFACFRLADAHYQEFVYRPLQLKYGWRVFFFVSALSLVLGVRSGFGVVATAFVGVIWLLLYRRQVGQSWGFERFITKVFAASFLVLLLAGEPTLTTRGAWILAAFGVMLFVLGITDWITERRVVRRIRKEAGDLD